METSAALTQIRQFRYQRNFDAAIAACNAAITGGGDPLLLLERGYVHLEVGKRDEARRDLEQTDLPEARFMLSAGRIEGFFQPEKATFRAYNFEPRMLLKSLRTHGCALIKGLFYSTDLADFDRRISHNLVGVERALEKAGAPQGFNVGYPLYFAGSNWRFRVHRTLRKSYPSLFDPERMRRMDCLSLARFVFAELKRTQLNAVIRDYLGLRKLYTSAAACQVHRIAGCPEPTAEQEPAFNQDNRLYQMEQEILTLWLPLRYQQGAMPSIELLPIRTQSHLPCHNPAGLDRSMFDENAYWRPNFALGDALLISGFTPRRTCYPRGNTNERISVDFRFFPTPLPQPIYEEA